MTEDAKVRAPTCQSSYAAAATRENIMPLSRKRNGTWRVSAGELGRRTSRATCRCKPVTSQRRVDAQTNKERHAPRVSGTWEDCGKVDLEQGARPRGRAHPFSLARNADRHAASARRAAQTISFARKVCEPKPVSGNQQLQPP